MADEKHSKKEIVEKLDGISEKLKKSKFELFRNIGKFAIGDEVYSQLMYLLKQDLPPENVDNLCKLLEINYVVPGFFENSIEANRNNLEAFLNKQIKHQKNLVEYASEEERLLALFVPKSLKNNSDISIRVAKALQKLNSLYLNEAVLFSRWHEQLASMVIKTIENWESYQVRLEKTKQEKVEREEPGGEKPKSFFDFSQTLLLAQMLMLYDGESQDLLKKLISLSKHIRKLDDSFPEFPKFDELSKYPELIKYSVNKEEFSGSKQLSSLDDIEKVEKITINGKEINLNKYQELLKYIDQLYDAEPLYDPSCRVM